MRSECRIPLIIFRYLNDSEDWLKLGWVVTSNGASGVILTNEKLTKTDLKLWKEQ